jgi:hypothetical protein
MFISFKLASISSLLALVSAAPAAETFDKRGLVLGTGDSVAIGNLPNYTYIYRVAGYATSLSFIVPSHSAHRYLEHGCPAGTGVSASGCYTIKLSPDPTKNIDPAESSGTQKIQDVLLSSPSYPANGPVTKHNFKLKIGSSLTSTSAQPLPVVQLVSKEVPNGSANTVTLDLRNKQGRNLRLRCPQGLGSLQLVGRKEHHSRMDHQRWRQRIRQHRDQGLCLWSHDPQLQCCWTELVGQLPYPRWTPPCC